jgi:hypothetical protein
VKITVFWNFMPCGLEMCTSQGLAASIIRAGDDISQTRQSGAVFRTEIAEGEVNMQDFLLYIILLHSNISMPSCILVRGFICFPA